MNRYDEYAKENQTRITELKARIARIRAGAPARANAIQNAEEEIATLERQVSTFRGTSKLVNALYGA